MSCELCASTGGTLLWKDSLCRVVHVDDPDYGGYCRVIWNKHVKEMTDLTAIERTRLLHVLLGVETVLRACMQPDKINLASLGNVTPHLHWHVVPRFVDDAHFPQSIWSERQRDKRRRDPPSAERLAGQLAAALGTPSVN